MDFLMNPRHFFDILNGVDDIGKTKFKLCLLTIHLLNLCLKYPKIKNLELKW